jgi:hypothetical protein
MNYETATLSTLIKDHHIYALQIIGLSILLYFNNVCSLDILVKLTIIQLTSLTLLSSLFLLISLYLCLYFIRTRIQRNSLAILLTQLVFKMTL